jgi:hypothetical protein
MSSSAHFIQGEFVQVWDGLYGGTVDELPGHGEIGVVVEQVNPLQYIVALPKTCSQEIYSVDWLLTPNLFIIQSQILNQ